MAHSTYMAGLMSLALVGAVRADSPEDQKLGSEAKRILGKYCHACHKGPGSKGGDVDFLDFKGLRESAKDGSEWVVPGKPAESAIIQKSELGVTKDGAGMPPKSQENRQDKDEHEILVKWVAAGCPDAGEKKEPKRTFRGPDYVLNAMFEHLKSSEDVDQPYLRFFTLDNIHNDMQVTHDQLQRYRAALAEAVNSLSWKRRIVQPMAVEEDRIVFVVDIRDFGWEKRAKDQPVDAWENMITRYPYGLSYVNSRPKLGNVERGIQQNTNCRQAHVRIDWFVANATRPPMYHEFLKIPATAGELEYRLDVNIADNFLRNRMVRAGFTKSGVSRQHRMVERHDALYGAYWKSYDFKQGNAKGDLQRFPLGPVSFPSSPRYQNPFVKKAFEHDGGEIIFHLPNGLQGYMLVDEKDRRLDGPAPINVVSDPNETSGTVEIINGLSCINCHAQGMRRPDRGTVAKPASWDVIRGTTSVTGDDLRKTELLYPTHSTMEKYLDEDQEIFLSALVKTIGSYVTEKEIRAKGHSDPVGFVAKRHNQPINLETAAAELGVTGKFIVDRIGQNGLKGLNLGALGMPGGDVKREDWEGGALSRMQRLAEELQTASPNR